MAAPMIGMALLLLLSPTVVFAGTRLAAQTIDLDRLTKLSNEELRGALIGKSTNSDPSGKMASGMGQNEYFHKNGLYGRDDDRVFTTGKYTIENGQVCIVIDRASGSEECRFVYRSPEGLLYFHRSAAPQSASPWKIVVTPLPK